MYGMKIKMLETQCKKREDLEKVGELIERLANLKTLYPNTKFLFGGGINGNDFNNAIKELDEALYETKKEIEILKPSVDELDKEYKEIKKEHQTLLDSLKS